MFQFKCIAVVLGLIFITEASALDIHVSGSAGTSQQSMSLDIRDRSFKASFTNLELAVTAAIGPYYVTLNQTSSVKDDTQTDGGGLLFYSREESTINFGYNVWRQLTLFGGYRSGKTPAVYFRVDPASAANTGGGQFSITSKGLFAGGSYGFKLGNGNLGVNLAIASLEGNVSLFEPFVDRSRFNSIASVPNKVVGDALGFSYGLSWQAQLGKSSTYAVGLKLHRYDFEDSQIVGGIDLSFQENFDIFFISLIKHF